MNKYNHKSIVLMGLLLLLGSYLFVLLSVDMLHNHDADFNFHDNCPACQWSQQAFENDTVLVGMQTALDAQHAKTQDEVYLQNEAAPPALAVITPLTRRGPPTPTV